jgi:hypothetical protein
MHDRSFAKLTLVCFLFDHFVYFKAKNKLRFGLKQISIYRVNREERPKFHECIYM